MRPGFTTAFSMVKEKTRPSCRQLFPHGKIEEYFKHRTAPKLIGPFSQISLYAGCRARLQKFASMVDVFQGKLILR
jgi:hypothetical protein